MKRIINLAFISLMASVMCSCDETCAHVESEWIIDAEPTCYE
ncbi:MAG: hypothetical protein ACI311_01085 [Bacilli bacterium]